MIFLYSIIIFSQYLNEFRTQDKACFTFSFLVHNIAHSSCDQPESYALNLSILIFVSFKLFSIVILIIILYSPFLLFSQIFIISFHFYLIILIRNHLLNYFHLFTMILFCSVLDSFFNSLFNAIFIFFPSYLEYQILSFIHLIIIVFALFNNGNSYFHVNVCFFIIKLFIIFDVNQVNFSFFATLTSYFCLHNILFYLRDPNNVQILHLAYPMLFSQQVFDS